MMAQFGGNLADISSDLRKIKEIGKDLGLQLNAEKSEFISHNQTSADSPLSSFPDLPFVNPSQATLLGSPLGRPEPIIH